MTSANIWRWTALSGYFALLGAITLWNTLISPPDRQLIAVTLSLLLIPLLAGLRGILHARRHTHGWLGMVALLYFVLGVGDAYADPVDRPYGIVMIVFSLMLFIGSIGYIRSGKSSGERLKEKGKRE